MQIRRPRGITVPQLMVITALGVLGGVYIWQPLIVKWKKENSDKKEQTTGTITAGPATETSAKSVLLNTKVFILKNSYANIVMDIYSNCILICVHLFICR